MNKPLTRFLPRPRFGLSMIGLILVPAGGLLAEDAEFMAIFKLQNFVQVSPNIVSLADENSSDPEDAPFLFEAFADLSSPGSLTSGSVDRPSGPDVPMVEESGFGELIHEAGFELRSEMDATFGDGLYTMNLVGAIDGPIAATLDLSGNGYPGLIRFTNFGAAQNIDASGNFTLQWELLNGAAADSVLVCIEDKSSSVVFETPESGEPGALTGADTSVEIPAGTLSAGMNYEVLLEAIREDDVDEPYGMGSDVRAVSAYGKTILMEVRTMGVVADPIPPSLNGSAPSPNELGVELNTIVTFFFDEPMDTAVDVGQAVGWSGLPNPSLFDYSWSPKGDTLFCNYAPGFPPSATVGWTLNAAGSTAKLRDAAGNDLPNDLTGQFGTSDTSNLGIPDVMAIEIIKGKAFFQDSDSPVDLDSYFAEFFVELNGISTVSSVDLGIPGGGVELNVGELLFNSEEIRGEANFAEKADLDGVFPNGSYPFTLHAFHDGEKAVTLDFGADDYPNVPTIDNFAATQAWDSNQPLTLQWAPMDGESAGDFISVVVEGNNTCFFESPVLGEPGALNGTSTSITIPAGSLPPGRTLDGELVFSRILSNDTAQYPGVRVASAFVTITEFEIQTIGGPFQPGLKIVHQGPQATVTITGERGRSYEVRSSEDLEDWTVREHLTLFSKPPGFRASSEFHDDVFGVPKRFYQVEEVSSGP